jgi:DNA modification methylase
MFAGSGTVGEVCLEHGRNAVLIELNPDYCGIIERRLNCTRE